MPTLIQLRKFKELLGPRTWLLFNLSVVLGILWAGVDLAFVTVSVMIAGDGAVSDVAVKDDPGNGFGREARRCAQRKRWVGALDRAGQSVAVTRLIRIKFER